MKPQDYECPGIAQKPQKMDAVAICLIILGVLMLPLIPIAWVFSKIWPLQNK